MSLKRRVLLVSFVFLLSLAMILGSKVSPIVMFPEQAKIYVEEPFFSWKDLACSLVLTGFFLVLMWRLGPSILIREGIY